MKLRPKSGSRTVSGTRSHVAPAFSVRSNVPLSPVIKPTLSVIIYTRLRSSFPDGRCGYQFFPPLSVCKITPPVPPTPPPRPHPPTGPPLKTKKKAVEHPSRCAARATTRPHLMRRESTRGRPRCRHDRHQRIELNRDQDHRMLPAFLCGRSAESSRSFFRRQCFLKSSQRHRPYRFDPFGPRCHSMRYRFPGSSPETSVHHRATSRSAHETRLPRYHRHRSKPN